MAATARSFTLPSGAMTRSAFQELTVAQRGQGRQLREGRAPGPPGELGATPAPDGGGRAGVEKWSRLPGVRTAAVHQCRQVAGGEGDKGSHAGDRKPWGCSSLVGRGWLRISTG